MGAPVLKIPSPIAGYTAPDLRELARRAGGLIERPEDIRRVIDSYGYLAEWKRSYRILSVRSSLWSEQITCVDAAVLSYGLLELLFPEVKRRLLPIHRRDMKGEECGHCVTLYWGPDGRVGAFSKSSFAGLDHRAASFEDEWSIAMSYAEAYLRMRFQPLYFGITTLEEVAAGLDWRFAEGDLNILSERLKETYQYGFECGT